MHCIGAVHCLMNNFNALRKYMDKIVDVVEGYLEIKELVYKEAV